LFILLYKNSQLLYTTLNIYHLFLVVVQFTSFGFCLSHQIQLFCHSGRWASYPSRSFGTTT